MTPLEQHSIGKRIAITFIIVLVVLLLLALIGWLSGGWDEAKSEALPPRVATKWDARILELDVEALDRAYVENSVRLFAVWMKDDHDQPRRMLVGLTQSRKAYNAARDRIEAHKRGIEDKK